MIDTFPCPACGAPNEPKAGRSQIACSYCGANLTIPASMRREASPEVEKTVAKAAPLPRQEIDASGLLRQAQPVVAKAWNIYALWTWVRRIWPTCLVIALIGICICIILSALPFIMN